MKKILVCLAMLSLAGCTEKQEYEQVVLEQIKADKEISDYKIDPEIMTDCVVKTSADNMPGMFMLDPERLKAYKNYTKMLKMNSSSDPKKTLEELRNEFGSPRNLADAHANYTETFLNCMSGLVTEAEKSSLKNEEK